MLQRGFKCKISIAEAMVAFRGGGAAPAESQSADISAKRPCKIRPPKLSQLKPGMLRDHIIPRVHTGIQLRHSRGSYFTRTFRRLTPCRSRNCRSSLSGLRRFGRNCHHGGSVRRRRRLNRTAGVSKPKSSNLKKRRVMFQY